MSEGKGKAHSEHPHCTALYFRLWPRLGLALQILSKQMATNHPDKIECDRRRLLTPPDVRVFKKQTTFASLVHPAIPRFVGREFLFPERAVAGGDVSMPWAAVPTIAVHEDGKPHLAENIIRFAENRLMPTPTAGTGSAEQFRTSSLQPGRGCSRKQPLL